MAGSCGTGAEARPLFSVREKGVGRWWGPTKGSQLCPSEARHKPEMFDGVTKGASSWLFAPALRRCLPDAGAALYGMTWKERGVSNPHGLFHPALGYPMQFPMLGTRQAHQDLSRHLPAPSIQPPWVQYSAWSCSTSSSMTWMKGQSVPSAVSNILLVWPVWVSQPSCVPSWLLVKIKSVLAESRTLL